MRGVQSVAWYKTIRFRGNNVDGWLAVHPHREMLEFQSDCGRIDIGKT